MRATTFMLRPLSDFESHEASLFFLQLEDLSKGLWDGLQDIGPEELAWQLTPGTNTIGMLLAHIAITEVFWISVLTERAFLCEQVLGIGSDDDGMPMPHDAKPPELLAGRTLSYFGDLLLKARENTRKWLMSLTANDLDRDIEVRGRTQTQTMNGRWMLFHIVEHQAGHYGQINMLRHLYRAMTPARPTRA